MRSILRRRRRGRRQQQQEEEPDQRKTSTEEDEGNEGDTQQQQQQHEHEHEDNTKDAARDSFDDDKEDGKTKERVDPPNGRAVADGSIAAKKLPAKTRSSWPCAAVRFLAAALQLGSTAFVVWGVYAGHTRLFNADECDMTWSQREFFQIAMPSSSTTRTSNNHGEEPTTSSSNEYNHYRLYKFVDRRDPRYAHFPRGSRQRPLADGDGWCPPPPRRRRRSADGDATATNSTTTSGSDATASASAEAVVLYVPGHGGSYEQSRSLGAHGVGMTRRSIDARTLREIRARLLGGDAEGTADDLRAFFAYDVYAVDFREAPSGLHGAFLEEQADFVLDAVRHLLRACGNDNREVVLVGHSIGGYVARLAAAAALSDPDLRHRIKSIVTLGTPHRHPVMTWEAGMQRVHERMVRGGGDQNNDGGDLAIISVSGGLRDEMIPSASCEVSERGASVTVMATDIMVPPIDDNRILSPMLGMDHRAIVWCHNLLDPVRTIIRSLVAGNGTTAEDRVRAVKQGLSLGNDDDTARRYSNALEKQHTTLRVSSTVLRGIVADVLALG